MALKFSNKDRRCVPKWDGNEDLPPDEQISCYFSPLRVKDMFAIQRDTDLPILAGAEVDPKDVEMFDKYWTMVEHVLRTYTHDYCNIEVDEEKLTTPDQVLEALRAEHMGLLALIFSEVVSASSGNAEDAKNSDGQSEQESLEYDLTAAPVDEKGSEKSETVVETT